jgi:serine protease Do
MRRWQAAGAAALVLSVVAALAIWASRVEGQERSRDRDEEPLTRVFALAEAFGSQAIGVTVRETEKEATGGKNLSPGSVVVDDVREGSPADKAGVREGDVVLEWDGERVRSSRQFRRLVEETARGREATMVLSRDGKRLDLKVTPDASEFDTRLGERSWRFREPILPKMPPMDWERLVPEVEIHPPGRARLGIQIDDLTEQLAQYFGVKEGVLVTSVAVDSAAAKAGIRAGDVITRVDGTPIRDTADVRDELRRIDDDREFSIEVSRDRKPVTLKAQMEPRRSPTVRRGTRTERF